MLFWELLTLVFIFVAFAACIFILAVVGRVSYVCIYSIESYLGKLFGVLCARDTLLKSLCGNEEVDFIGVDMIKSNDKQR